MQNMQHMQNMQNMQNVQRVHNVQNMQNVVNMQNISFSVFLLCQQMLSFSKYFPPFPSPNIFLLFLFRSSSPKSKCHEVQSPMSRFNIVDLFSPRIGLIFFAISPNFSPYLPFPIMWATCITYGRASGSLGICRETNKTGQITYWYCGGYEIIPVTSKNYGFMPFLVCKSEIVLASLVRGKSEVNSGIG